MHESKSSRLVTAAFGTLLVGCAILTVVVVDPSIRWRGVAVALVLGLLGLDAIVASVRGRASVASRIGPLP